MTTLLVWIALAVSILFYLGRSYRPQLDKVTFILGRWCAYFSILLMVRCLEETNYYLWLLPIGSLLLGWVLSYLLENSFFEIPLIAISFSQSLVIGVLWHYTGAEHQIDGLFVLGGSSLAILVGITFVICLGVNYTSDDYVDPRFWSPQGAAMSILGFLNNVGLAVRH